MAALMASNALSMDAMLPALPTIGETLGVSEPNHRQLVISAYLLGFGGSQLFFGPLSDSFGRKGLLVTSLVLYAIFGFVAGLAGSFNLLLAARALQGVAAGAARVLAISIVRDRFEGEAMARVMSLTMIVFMIVPVLAPSIGQAIVAVGTWRHIFIVLSIYGLAMALWSAWRLPETLHVAQRRPLSWSYIGEAAWLVLKTRQSIGNTLVQALGLGTLFAFLNSIQQIVSDVFARPELIGSVFACIAGPMAISSYINSRLVLRLGSRRILLAGLCAFTVTSVAHLLVAGVSGETIWMFVLFQAGTMSLFALIGANAGALAMQPLGQIAGTASSVQGTIATVGGTFIGYGIGQHFNGSIMPFLIGISMCGALGVAAALWANRPEPRGLDGSGQSCKWRARLRTEA